MYEVIGFFAILGVLLTIKEIVIAYEELSKN